MAKAIPEKTYDFKAVEDKLYLAWQKDGCFTPKIDPEKQPYTIVIPPPNITGQLHMKGTCHHRLCVGRIGAGMIVTVS